MHKVASSVTVSTEELREALVDLEAARTREHKLRMEAEGLLHALNMLTASTNTQTMFANLLDVLRGFIPFEQGFVLLPTSENRLEAGATTEPIFEASVWHRSPSIERVLKGECIAFFDVSESPEWVAQTSAVRSKAGSALYSPVILDARAEAILVLTHSRCAQFTRQHVKLMQRFGPLVAQALINIRYRESLEANQALLEHQKIALERSNADLEQFAYVASHDLQEPLRMVTTYLQFIEHKFEGQLGEDTREMLNFAIGGAKRMSNLIRSLLTLSRVDSGGEDFRPVDSKILIQNAMDNLAITIKEAGARIELPSTTPVVNCDANQITSVFQNLVNNALKFRRPNTPPVITISVERSRENWIFSVRDNGIGIEDEYRGRIFRVFERLHQGYAGTGIGLAVVKRIIVRHGGGIWVDSVPEPESGTIFSFSLPTIRHPILSQLSH